MIISILMEMKNGKKKILFQQNKKILFSRSLSN